jgi:DNA-binding LacI/PurR family transcriptional regulator
MSQVTCSKTPKYLILANEMRSQIEQGVLLPGDRLPTFLEMHERHGVTVSTVNRIYTHLENDGLIVREPGRGTYVKAKTERLLTGVIGVAVPFSQGPYFVSLLEGAYEEAAKAGIELSLLGDEYKVTREKFDGILFCDTGFAKRDLWHHVPEGLPCVATLVGARNFSCVLGDEYQGSYDLTRRLIEKGHRRIGYIHDPYLPPRLDGYRDALRHAGIAIDERLIRTVAYDQTAERGYCAAGYVVMSDWLKEDWAELDCYALMTQNDDAAIGVIQALSKAGWSVPEQVSVAGFDGIAQGRYFLPRLTSVEVPLREIGSTAMKLLLRQIRGEEVGLSTVVLPTRFIEGESVLSYAETKK